MKPKNILLSSIFLLAMFSCNGGKPSTSDLITVDGKNWYCKTSSTWNTCRWRQRMSL